MRTLTAAALAAGIALAATAAMAQQDKKMHPFILAANGPGQVAQVEIGRAPV